MTTTRTLFLFLSLATVCAGTQTPPPAEHNEAIKPIAPSGASADAIPSMSLISAGRDCGNCVVQQAFSRNAGGGQASGNSAPAAASIASEEPARQAPSAPAAAAVVTLTCLPARAAILDAVTCNVENTGKDNLESLSVAVSPKNKAVAASVDLPEGATVALQDGKGSFVLLFTKMPVPAPEDGVTEIVTVSDANKSIQEATSVVVSAVGTYTGGQIMRLVGGTTAAFAPNANPTAKLFADFYWETGIGCSSGCGKDANAFGSPFRYWLQATALSTSTAAGNTDLSAGLPAITAISAESLSFRSGLSWRLGTTQADLDGIPHGPSTSAVEWIAGVGFTTPLQAAPKPTVYCALAAGCPALSGNQSSPVPPGSYLVLNGLTRTSFLGSWETGFRFQTFYNHNTDSFQPAITDITIGKDEAVTSGRFGRFVIHFNGFWPLPGNFDYVFLIFGGAIRFPGNSIGFSSLLSAQTVDTSKYTGSLSGSGFQQIYPPQDTFRVGLAIDIVDLIKNHLFGGVAANGTPQ